MSGAQLGLTEPRKMTGCQQLFRCESSTFHLSYDTEGELGLQPLQFVRQLGELVDHSDGLLDHGDVMLVVHLVETTLVQKLLQSHKQLVVRIEFERGIRVRRRSLSSDLKFKVYLKTQVAHSLTLNILQLVLYV